MGLKDSKTPKGFAWNGNKSMFPQDWLADSGSIWENQMKVYRIKWKYQDDKQESVMTEAEAQKEFGEPEWEELKDIGIYDKKNCVHISAVEIPE